MRIFPVLLLLAQGVAFADAAKVTAKKLPAAYSPVKGVDFTLSVLRGRVVAKIRSGATQDLGPFDSTDIQPATDEVVFGDFNFDGTVDVGVLEGVGYGGVNLFYRVYLYDRIAGKFSQFKTNISNPTLHNGRKFLISAQRSGPRWYQTVYRSDAGSLVRVFEAEMLNHPTLWGVTEYNNQDILVAQRVLDGKTLERDPASKTVPAVVLRPGECSERVGVRKKGEAAKVEVIDFRDGGETLKVRPEAIGEGIWLAVECLADL